MATSTNNQNAIPNTNKQNHDCEFDDDDDEWNDADLAAIDLSMAMTQYHGNNTPASAGSSGAAVTTTTTNIPDACTSNTVQHNSTNNQTNHSEFSDDDDDAFAQVDFSVLDNTIEQHQLLLTQQFQSSTL